MFNNTSTPPVSLIDNWNVTNSATINSTIGNTTVVLTQHWNAITITCLVTLLSGVFGNGLLLCVFARERSLVTPFNIYVINLLFLNLSAVIIQYPMDFITYLNDGVWLLGERACDAYNYAAWPLQALVMNSHALMAINRIWAIAYPISYRTIHSVRTALCLCALAWLYIHAAFLPMIIQDSMYYRLPVESNGCSVSTDKQIKYCAVLEYIIWQAQFIMTLAFPIIFFIRRARKKKALQKGQANLTGTVSSKVTSSTSNQVGPANMVDAPQELVVDGAVVSLDTPRIIATGLGDTGSTSGTSKGHPVLQDAVQINPPAGLENPATKKAKKANSSHGLLLLALLTSSANICWTPSNFYFTWILYKPIDDPVLYFVQYMLFALQTTIDSVMITLAFPKLRAALKRFWTCRPPVP